MGQIARLMAPVLAAAVALAVGLAAAAPAVNIATYKGPDREKLILDGAKREGKVSIYSGMIENQALRPLVEAFEKKYPFVDVEYWRGDSRAMVQKLFSEQRARRIVGDLFESTGGAGRLAEPLVTGAILDMCSTKHGADRFRR